MSLEQFMRRRGTGILLLVNGALLAGGGYLWVDSQGELRNVAWVPPEAQAPSILAVGLPAGAGGGEADVNRFVATTDRPLFSPSRRPPPPPPPPAPPKPVDPLADIQLFGVYGGKASGGILAKFNGKIQVAEILNVKHKAIIHGEVTVGKLSVEPGADFSASCKMKTNSKISIPNDGQPKSEETN